MTVLLVLHALPLVLALALNRQTPLDLKQSLVVDLLAEKMNSGFFGRSQSFVCLEQRTAS
jgi:hypothetical protein